MDNRKEECYPMTDKEMIAAARLIARLAHRGQVDKAGDDYFAHPEAVAAMLDEPEAKVVGYLHDTVEDTEVTIPEIREVFGDRIADAVALLTHADGVPYMDYVKEIGKNPLTIWTSEGSRIPGRRIMTGSRGNISRLMPI